MLPFNRRNVWIFLSLDIIVVISSLFLAYLLRFDFQISVLYLNQIFELSIIYIFSKLSINIFYNVYSGLWRFTSLPDLINIIKSNSIGTMLAIVVVFLTVNASSIPRSIYLLDFIFSTMGFIGTRTLARIYSEKIRQFRKRPFQPSNKNKTKLLLLGAGWSGEKIIREIFDSNTGNYRIVGLLDDDESKLNTTIHGIQVLGKIEEIHSLSCPFDEILICMPTAKSAQMRSIVDHCEMTKKPYRTVPTIAELIDKKVSLNVVREVTISDLLGRQEVALNRSEISKYIFGKKVLITGAGGSIGSELVKQCIGFDPDLLILFDQSENNLFNIENHCDNLGDSIGLQTILGDIRDQEILDSVFNSFKPDVVIHAAAYKHVPMQELNPWEAINTNVKGTLNLVQASENHNVDRFVLVSTDKAVNPTNVMGATKRIAEKIIQAKSRDSKVKYMAVRFGNVIGSSGSVVPIFQEQIKNGGPVTITDPKIKRYFMSIPEAAQLILQAGSFGKGGEIFVLDMGDPVLVKDIAIELIKLSGFTPEIDIPINYVGLRPGEKMFEELITSGEGISESPHSKIMVLKNDISHGWNIILGQAEDLIDKGKSFNVNIIKKSLKKLLPEYEAATNTNYNTVNNINIKKQV
jgi:FlaA1/EpsC-like NDP-sugar epimerase